MENNKTKFIKIADDEHIVEAGVLSDLVNKALGKKPYGEIAKEVAENARDLKGLHEGTKFRFLDLLKGKINSPTEKLLTRYKNFDAGESMKNLLINPENMPQFRGRLGTSIDKWIRKMNQQAIGDVYGSTIKGVAESTTKDSVEITLGELVANPNKYVIVSEGAFDQSVEPVINKIVKYNRDATVQSTLIKGIKMLKHALIVGAIAGGASYVNNIGQSIMQNNPIPEMNTPGVQENKDIVNYIAPDFVKDKIQNPDAQSISNTTSPTQTPGATGSWSKEQNPFEKHNSRTSKFVKISEDQQFATGQPIPEQPTKNQQSVQETQQEDNKQQLLINLQNKISKANVPSPDEIMSFIQSTFQKYPNQDQAMNVIVNELSKFRNIYDSVNSDFAQLLRG